MKIAFLLPSIQLAGGIYIVLEHANGLAARHGYDVTIVLSPDENPGHDYPSLDSLRCVGIEAVAGKEFDVAVATWWETVYALPRLKAARLVHFIQNQEDRFYTPDEVARRSGAGAVQALPIAHVATSRWLERQLLTLRPDAQVYQVPSGVDKEVFRIEEPAATMPDEPLRIVVEGPPDVWFKGVPEALEAAARMREPHHLTVVTGDRPPSPQVEALADRVESRLSHREFAALLGDAHLLLKLSRVEGMAGPPLEAFHKGATAVLTPVTGHDEYAVHGLNCQIVGFDDIAGTAQTLDLLARDRDFLHELRINAVATAREWPDWKQSTALLARALEEIANAPPAAGFEYTRQVILETQALYTRQPELAYRPPPRPPFRERLTALWQSAKLLVGSDERRGAIASPTGRSPSLQRRVWWVWRHEGARGFASRGARTARAAIDKLR